MASSGRFYFQTEDGQDFTHELQGSVFEGCGAFVDMKAANKQGASCMDRRRTSVTCFIGKRATRTITCADFEGRTVRVKLWFPNDDARDFFYLVPEAK